MKEIESLNVHSEFFDLLYLKGGSSLKQLPLTTKEMESLNLSNTSIYALPASIWGSTNLSELCLQGWDFIDELSDD